MSSIKIKDPKTGKWEEVPYFQGEPGTDGITPHIGPNGNWFVGDADTGMPSRGADGAQGPQGVQGEPGEKGDTGAAGKDGSDYVLTSEDLEEIATLAAMKVREDTVLGSIDENNNILLSGSLADGTYVLKYKNEDGTYTEVGTLKVGSVTETYTNLADPTSADWQEGYRLSISSGGVSELAGHVSTNYIHCKAGNVLRVKGLNVIGQLTTDGSGNQNNAKIVMYDGSKAALGGLYGLTTEEASANNYGAKVDVDGDISTYTVLYNNEGTQMAQATCEYIRIDGALMDGYTSEDVIITINEKIV